MERIDDLQYKGLKLIQDDELFCFGCDAVELANFVKGSNADACDLGCGNGIIATLIAAKRGMRVTGVEIQPESASLAERNARLNSLADRIEIVCARMQDFAAQSANVGRFKVVVANPPYRKQGSGFKQESRAVAVARHELEVTLSEVISCASRLLSSGGKFYTVGQSQRLAETLNLCTLAKLTPKVLQILRPCDGKPPHLFLLECKKDGKDGMIILPEREVFSDGV
ncbi:MAG: methyltransferase [Clostridia bacterium]|nr:methyltransferase [Clostridia bacterium]